LPVSFPVQIIYRIVSYRTLKEQLTLILKMNAIETFYTITNNYFVRLIADRNQQNYASEWNSQKSSFYNVI